MVVPVSSVCPQVRLSTKSFGIEAATVAADALRAVAHSLEHADISDIIAGRPVSSDSNKIGSLLERCRHHCVPQTEQAVLSCLMSCTFTALTQQQSGIYSGLSICNGRARQNITTCMLIA